ncbi:MAG: hypothetical protein NVS3B20_13090 [Polyangiales bacterium]
MGSYGPVAPALPAPDAPSSRLLGVEGDPPAIELEPDDDVAPAPFGADCVWEGALGDALVAQALKTTIEEASVSSARCEEVSADGRFGADSFMARSYCG